MKLIICAASINEISRIIDHYNAHLVLSHKHKYSVYFHSDKDDIYYFLIIGMGLKNVKKNLNFFIDKFQLDHSFRWILTGFCGAVKPGINTGSIIFPRIVKDDVRSFTIDQKGFQYKSGYTLFSVNKIYGRNGKKELVRIHPEADVIDMEGTGFCEIMNEYDISNFIIYKSITDNRDFIFPDYRLIRRSIFSVPLKILFSVMIKDPRQLKHFFMIYRNMRKASKEIFKAFFRLSENNEDKRNKNR